MHIKLNGQYEQGSELYSISTDEMVLQDFPHTTIDERVFHFCGEIIDSQLMVSHYVNGLLLNNGVAFLKGPKNIDKKNHPFVYMLGLKEQTLDIENKGFYKVNGIWMPALYNQGTDVSKLSVVETEYYIEKYKTLLTSFLETNNKKGDLWYEDLVINGAINSTSLNIELI